MSELVKTKEALLENGDVLELPIAVNYHYITEQEEAEQILAELYEYAKHEENFMAVDIETNGYCPYRNKIYLLQIGIPLPEKKQYIFDVRYGKIDPELFRPVLEAPCWKLGHNIRFDARFIKQHYNINILNHVFDTFVAEKVLEGGIEEKNYFTLDSVVKRRTTLVMQIRSKSLKTLDAGSVDTIVEQAKKRLQGSFPKHPIEKPFSAAQLAYAASDVAVLFPLMKVQLHLLKTPFPNMLYEHEFSILSDPQTRAVYNRLYPEQHTLWHTAALEFSFLEVVAYDLELGGVGFDVDTHAQVVQYVREEYKEYKKDFLHMLSYNTPQKTLLGTAAVNPDSPSQVLTALIHNLQLDIPEKSTKVQVLERLDEGLSYILKKKESGRKIEEGDVRGILRVEEEHGKAVFDTSKIERQQKAVNSLLAYRKTAKLLDSFGDKLVNSINPVTGRIHSSINTIIRTGRMSVREPNFQQIPKYISWKINDAGLTEEQIKDLKDGLDNRPGFRECFVPKEGYSFIVTDYSQQELRIAASTCNDHFMRKAYEDEKDLHSAMAASIMGKTYEEFLDLKDSGDKDAKHIRDVAKTVNFGLIYGLSPFNLSRKMNISMEEAQALFDSVWDTYKGVKDKLEKVHAFANKYHYSNTVMGRKRLYKDLNDKIIWILAAKSPEQLETIARKNNMSYLYEGVNEKTGKKNQITEENFQKTKDRMVKKFRGEISRQAGNHMVQGSAGDATKVSAISLRNRLQKEGLDAKIVLIVHDELVVEARDDQAEYVKQIVEVEMNKAMELFFPLVPSVAEGNIDKTWIK